ncbi:unnamed protein product [Pleuronectes platessa]|uniref:Uncharacterized protein n=1 Tax=Pleuronectes platessa TaxID=8262 RepID=A0A9N7YHA4_PLEPL|nr:unnamed protein product [Pleuronectes platessa]
MLSGPRGLSRSHSARLDSNCEPPRQTPALPLTFSGFRPRLPEIPSQPLMQTNGPVRFQFTSWDQCEPHVSFQSAHISDASTGAGERPKEALEFLQVILEKATQGAGVIIAPLQRCIQLGFDQMSPGCGSALEQPLPPPSGAEMFVSPSQHSED